MQDQYPVMQIDGKHYTMSLRMMKAVWCVCMCLLGLPLLGGSIKLGARRGRRSVRLRRGFINVERAPFGGEKLRIPSLLFVEKMRTQSRFNVRLVCVY